MIDISNSENNTSRSEEEQIKPLKTSWGWLVFIVVFATVIFFSIDAIIL